VAVIVGVAGPVIVGVHVHGNATVIERVRRLSVWCHDIADRKVPRHR